MPVTLPTFKNPALLQRALTHRSFVNEHPDEPEDNERLEFLGDAVVDLIAGAMLYHRYPEMLEGRLTRLRAALVRTEQLAAFAVKIGLRERLRLGRGEADTGGRERDSLLCGAFEALVGAYYIDAGYDAARAFVEPLLRPAVEHILDAESDSDPKSRLQEWAQAELGHTPTYLTISASGPEHSREFTVEARIGGEVYGVGAGRSKQAAAQAAAQAALRRMGLA